MLNTALLLKGKIDANQKQVDDGMGPMGGKINLTSPKIDAVIQRLTDLHTKALAGQPLTDSTPPASQAAASGPLKVIQYDAQGNRMQ